MNWYMGLILVSTLLTGAFFQATKNFDGADETSSTLFVPDDNSEAAAEEPSFYRQRNNIYLPFDQSDWAVLNSGGTNKIIKLTLEGFARLNGGKKIESVIVTDELQLKGVSKAFGASHSFRCAISDVSGCGIIVSFGKFNFGTLMVHMDDGRSVRIGITHEGFILGYDEGTVRQTFFNPALSDAILNLLHEDVASRFLKELAPGVSGSKYWQDRYQPDLEVVGGKYLPTNNLVGHPKIVNVPENIPFAIPSLENGNDNWIFARQLFEQGHFYGWNQYLDDCHSSQEYLAGNQNRSEFWQEGFEVGYSKCKSHLRKTIAEMGRSKVMELIEQEIERKTKTRAQAEAEQNKGAQTRTGPIPKE